MIKGLLTITFIAFTCMVSGQNTTCNCPANTLGITGKADRIFSLTGSRSIGLCGVPDTLDGHVAYSEFILYICGDNKTVREWSAMESCTIKQKNDTIVVEEFYGIANGKGFTINWQPFYVNKYYFSSGELIETSYFKKDLRKYTADEIKKVLKAYDKLAIDNGNYEAILSASHQLFWAWVSGSGMAGRYLESLETRFGPFDGHIAEEYKDLLATYEHYKDR